jgi:tRNA (guanine-N7-)-methyltransferase
LNSNHDIYKNRNAPDEVVNIQTYYESIYLKDDKKISYLSFNFNEQ